jgi:3-oxoacyl-[acyl-carrier-protein] synthase-1
MTPTVDIVAFGARTPLGMQAAGSAAAYRAGLSAAGEHPFMIDRLGDPMPGALDPGLSPTLPGTDRLMALVETALREVCAPLKALARRRLRFPMYLALPELRPGFSRRDADQIRARVTSVENLPIDISDVGILTEGHAGGLSALGLAADHIEQGRFDACLVGGVDSYFQPDTMEWLDANRQLVGADGRSAFVPGEAAGFCLLMSDRINASLGLRALAQVGARAAGRETKRMKTESICLGEGLTTVVHRVVSRLTPPSETVNGIICDINGERYRGEEWGFVCLRLPEFFDDPVGYSSPADCWGDVGAASGPLFAMLACHAAERGYGNGPRTLLWGSSEGGLRAAVLLTNADSN